MAAKSMTVFLNTGSDLAAGREVGQNCFSPWMAKALLRALEN